MMHRRQFLASTALLAIAGSAAPALAGLPTGFQDYNKERFEALLKGSKPVLVHVHADWCPVCVRQERSFNGLATSADFQKFAAVQVNFDMDKDFRDRFKVQNQSVILVIRDGKEVARLGGVSDQAKIAEFMAKALAGNA